MNEDKAQTDSQTSEVVCCAVGLCCSTKNNENEHAGEENLGEQTTQCRNCACAVCLQVVSACSLKTSRCGESIEDSRTNNGSDNLEHDVHSGVLAAHTSTEEHTECDCRIDVATRDATDGVCHCHNSKTKSDGCSDYCFRVTIVATQRYCCTAAHKNQHHCADCFC